MDKFIINTPVEERDEADIIVLWEGCVRYETKDVDVKFDYVGMEQSKSYFHTSGPLMQV